MITKKITRRYFKNYKCVACHRPMQYCDCKFADKLLDEIQVICNWQKSNVAPMTEYEYFQQIGSE